MLFVAPTPYLGLSAAGTRLVKEGGVSGKGEGSGIGQRDRDHVDGEGGKEGGREMLEIGSEMQH